MVAARGLGVLSVGLHRCDWCTGLGTFWGSMAQSRSRNSQSTYYLITSVTEHSLLASEFVPRAGGPQRGAMPGLDKASSRVPVLAMSTVLGLGCPRWPANLPRLTPRESAFAGVSKTQAQVLRQVLLKPRGQVCCSSWDPWLLWHLPFGLRRDRVRPGAWLSYSHTA